MVKVEVGAPRSVGWARVRAVGAPVEPAEADSETISMRLAAKLLREQDWAVADVHTEGRGYDLYAVRGREQRCVEVKGVWASASSAGIRMTGEERLIARQMAGDYWLYVVDDCQHGGKLYGAYADPARLFADLMQDVAVVRVPGSALEAVRREAPRK